MVQDDKNPRRSKRQAAKKNGKKSDSEWEEDNKAKPTIVYNTRGKKLDLPIDALVSSDEESAPLPNQPRPRRNPKRPVRFQNGLSDSETSGSEYDDSFAPEAPADKPALPAARPASPTDRPGDKAPSPARQVDDNAWDNDDGVLGNEGGSDGEDGGGEEEAVGPPVVVKKAVRRYYRPPGALRPPVESPVDGAGRGGQGGDGGRGRGRGRNDGRGRGRGSGSRGRRGGNDAAGRGRGGPGGAPSGRPVAPMTGLNPQIDSCARYLDGVDIGRCALTQDEMTAIKRGIQLDWIKYLSAWRMQREIDPETDKHPEKLSGIPCDGFDDYETVWQNYSMDYEVWKRHVAETGQDAFEPPIPFAQWLLNRPKSESAELVGSISLWGTGLEAVGASYQQDVATASNALNSQEEDQEESDQGTDDAKWFLSTRLGRSINGSTIMQIARDYSNMMQNYISNAKLSISRLSDPKVVRKMDAALLRRGMPVDVDRVQTIIRNTQATILRFKRQYMAFREWVLHDALDFTYRIRNANVRIRSHDNTDVLFPTSEMVSVPEGDPEYEQEAADVEATKKVTIAKRMDCIVNLPMIDSYLKSFEDIHDASKTDDMAEYISSQVVVTNPPGEKVQNTTMNSRRSAHTATAFYNQASYASGFPFAFYTDFVGYLSRCNIFSDTPTVAKALKDYFNYAIDYSERRAVLTMMQMHRSWMDSSTAFSRVFNPEGNTLPNATQYREAMQELCLSSSVPCPMAISTYPVVSTLTTEQYANLMLWPDRLAWCYRQITLKEPARPTPAVEGDRRDYARLAVLDYYLQTDLLEPGQWVRRAAFSDSLIMYRQNLTNRRNDFMVNDRRPFSDADAEEYVNRCAVSSKNGNRRDDLEAVDRAIDLWSRFFDLAYEPYVLGQNTYFLCDARPAIAGTDLCTGQVEEGQFIRSMKTLVSNVPAVKHVVLPKAEFMFWTQPCDDIQQEIFNNIADYYQDGQEGRMPERSATGRDEAPMLQRNELRSSTKDTRIMVRQSVFPLVYEGVGRNAMFEKMRDAADHSLVPLNELRLAGYALGFQFRKVHENEPRTNLYWWKMIAKTHKPKGSSKKVASKESMTVPGFRWYPFVLDLSFVWENPDVRGGVRTERDKPQWLLLVFKALASFLYKLGEVAARNYLVVVKLSELQLRGGVTRDDVVFFLTKYLDFARCVHNDVHGEEPLYPHFAPDLVFIDAAVRHTTATVQKDDAGNFDMENVAVDTVPVAFDTKQAWLLRPLPSIQELWKMLMFAYQDFFKNAFGVGIPEGQNANLYQYLYADTSLESSSMKWPGDMTADLDAQLSGTSETSGEEESGEDDTGDEESSARPKRKSKRRKSKRTRRNAILGEAVDPVQQLQNAFDGDQNNLLYNLFRSEALTPQDFRVDQLDMKLGGTVRLSEDEAPYIALAEPYEAQQ
jgi:hypothetical protein